MNGVPRMFDAVIVGCGYLGRRAARHWIAQGKTVAALTRSRSDELAALGITPILGDVLDAESLRKLPAARTVLHAVGFDRTTGHTQREVYVQGLKNLLTAIRQPQRFIHISSTGVYAQTDGEWVDETFITAPTESSGHVVLEAEQVLKALCPEAIILRFAGIYGPGRILRKKQLLAGEALVGDAEKYLNLIHVDDGVNAVMAAESLGKPGEVYNIADDAPPTRREFYTFLAESLNAPAAKFETPVASRLESNRRVSNRKAHDQLKFVPGWSSFREGLVSALADPGS